MTPDALFQAFGQILADTFGKQGCFRQSEITLDEWKAIDDRWLTLKQMNLRKLMLEKEGTYIPDSLK